MLIEIYVKALLVGEEPASVLKFLKPKSEFHGRKTVRASMVFIIRERA